MVLQPHPTEAVAGSVELRGLMLVSLAGGSITAGVLTVGWWGRPIAWLMPVTAFLAATAAVVDWRTRRVPNRLTLTALIALAPITAALVVRGDVSPAHVVVGVALMAGPLLGANLITRSHLPGLGDVKLAGLLGVSLGAVGPTAAYVALLGSLVLGAVFGAVYQRRTGAQGFPLAPAISIASLVVLLVSSIVRGE